MEKYASVALVAFLVLKGPELFFLSESFFVA